MTETNYTPFSAYADLARSFCSVQADLQRALDSISENFLLPSQERAQLIDALERAAPMADPCYSLSATQMLKLTMLAALPGLDSFGEGAAKIVACADDLLVAMKEDDILYVAKQGDWGALAACLREYPAILVKKGVLAFIIEVLEGKSRPPSRPPSAKIAARNREIAWFVLMERERGVSDDPSIENAAKKFTSASARFKELPLLKRSIASGPSWRG